MDKKKIIDLKQEGKSNRAVARIMNINRKTVAKYWNKYNDTLFKIENEKDDCKIKELQDQLTAAPKYDASSRRTRILTTKFFDDLNCIINSEIEKERLLKTKKQNLTKRQIHSIMKRKGHAVGYSTLCLEIDKIKQRNRECFIRQEYDYGDRLEYDFGEVHLYINGQARTYYIAVFSSPASNFRWCYIYDNQKQEVFLDSHVKFFEMTKGVWKEAVYDNMRNVVKKFLGKNEKELNDELIKLATYYGFEINVTNAFSGNEKGHVENSVKTLRNWIFAERVEFESLEEAIEYKNRRLIEINLKSNIASELSVLKPAPPKYEIAKITTSKVDKYSFIQVECNKYSVPEYLVGYTVTTKIYHDKIFIYSNNEYVCEHTRLKGKGGYAVNFKHYINTLLKKPGAIRNSIALKHNPELNKVFCKYYYNDPKSFINIISMHKAESWAIIIDFLINAAKSKSLKYKFNEIKIGIPKPNDLALKTQRMIPNYKTLVIGG